MMRLNRYLAQAGVASRRKCDEIILQGKVTVNGEKVVELGVRVDEIQDKITFDGSPVNLPHNFKYIILNKPAGYITTAKDEFNRHTVLDLIPLEERIFPVGRLDYDTTGVLLLTNDGELSNQLIHPKYKFEKTYHALLDKLVKPVAIYHLQQGVELDGKKTAPCKIHQIRVVDNCSLLEIKIHEGRNRQIRRMFELFEYQVDKLDRIAFGPLTLAGLKRSEWRYLRRTEIEKLRENIHF
jgi:23S rRNA pseudouridine2605 synthase